MRLKTGLGVLAASILLPLSAVTGVAHAGVAHAALFGVDNTALATAEADGATVATVRVYAGTSVPRRWPKVPAGMTGIYSFKPPLPATADGSLDSALLTSLRKLPPGSWLTIWHEANDGRRGFTVGQYTAAVSHVANLIAANGLDIHFGQIFGAYPVRRGQDLRPWVVPGLAFYGVDGYQPGSKPLTPAQVFGQPFADIKAVDPSANLSVIETNVADPRTQSEVNIWARAVWQYACQQDVASFAFFQSPSTPATLLPSPWLMRRLSARVAAGNC